MMLKSLKFITNSILLFSLIASFSIFSKANAQYDNVIGQVPWAGNSISVRLVPEAPAPGENVKAVLQGSGVDLDRSLISWTLNDVKQTSGVGLKEFPFVANSSGKKQIVGATVTDQNNITLSSSASISPAEVNLIWEARSFTPPFYKGKALLPYQGSVVVSAQPSTNIDPKKLLYKWEFNNSSLGPQSGYGKQSIEIETGVIMRGVNVTVTVTSLDGTSYNASNSITIPQISPKPVLYSDSPIYGMLYNIAKSGTFNMASDEIKIKAEPYFFSNSSKHIRPDLNYVWSVNGEQTISTVPDTITLRKPGGTGQSTLSADIKNDAKLLQFASPFLLINY